MLLQNEILASVSAAANAVSDALQIYDFNNYSIQVSFTGADVAGTLILQATNILEPDNSFASTDWIDVDDSSQSVTSSTSHMWVVDGAGYRRVRAKWTYSSGTGNISMMSVVKQN